MSKKNTSLPSLRNPDWKTVKAQTEKIKKLLHPELISAGIKLSCAKIGFPKEHEQKFKT